MNGLENVVYIPHGLLFSLKKDEIILFADKWMKLENIMLGKVS
jgi:hypothetical protein